MKLACLFSGGKDSTYACYLAQQDHDVCCLIALASDNPDSYMFHTPNIAMTQKQAQAMRIPIIYKTIAGQQDTEVGELKEILRHAKDEYNFEGVITGAVASVYQATRIQQVCDELDLVVFNPLWQQDQIALLNEIVQAGFDVRISAIAAYPLDASWLGTKLTQDIIEKLQHMQETYDINPAGEGGETESIVLNGPNFAHLVQIENEQTQAEGHTGRWIVS